MSEAQRLRDIEGSIRALGIRQEVVERRLGKLDGFQDSVITVEEKKAQDLIDAEYKRIAQRDQFAVHAPVTLQQVLELYGDLEANMQETTVRAVVYDLWAMLRYEYADAMMAERRRTMFEAAEEQRAAAMATHVWVNWHGGECPVAWDTPVDVEFRDRTIVQNCPAEDWAWNHHGHQQSDIIAYRVVRP